MFINELPIKGLWPYVIIIYMFTYPVLNIYIQVISFFVQFPLIKHI